MSELTEFHSEVSALWCSMPRKLEPEMEKWKDMLLKVLHRWSPRAYPVKGEKPESCDHEWDFNLMLLSSPPKLRCLKCGVTRVQVWAEEPRENEGN